MLRNFDELMDFCIAQGFVESGGPTGDDYNAVRMTEDGSQLACFLVNHLERAAIAAKLPQTATIMGDARLAIASGMSDESVTKLLETRLA